MISGHERSWEIKSLVNGKKKNEEEEKKVKCQLTPRDPCKFVYARHSIKIYNQSSFHLPRNKI